MQNWRTNYHRYRELLQILLEKREDVRAYIGILLSLSAVSFFSVFALRPTLTTIGELVSQINNQRQVLETLNQKIKNLETAKTNLQKIKSDIAVLDQAIPTAADPQFAIRQVESLAKVEGVTPANITIGKTAILGTNSASDAQGKPSLAYPFSFTFQAEAPQTLSFLNNLKTLRRVLEIDEVTINRKVQVGSSDLIGGSTLQLIISGVLPYYPKQQ